MTTDITELAQSLKAAANKAKQANDLYLEGKITQSELAVEIKGYVGHLCNPNDFLALVEALEKAQQQMTESENRVRKQNRHICELFDDNTALQQRIAELESRTVTVKLPKPHAHLIWIQAGHAPDDYWDDVAVSHSEKDRCCDGSERYPVYARWEIEEMLAAAGIKVEAE